MRNIKLIFILCLLNFALSAQENELEHFRKELVTFLNYDTEKTGSLPKTDLNTYTLKKSMQDAFLAFVFHKESKDLKSLKKNGKTDGHQNYWYDKFSYSFSEQKRNRTLKSNENNLNFCIEFSGIYDYKLSNFVSIYIQQFHLGQENYVVYYYKLNSKGKYFIKNIKNNKVIYSDEANTSNAPIRFINNIDKEYILLLEDMGNDGQRALVLKRAKDTLESIQAFSGKSFLSNSNDYSEKSFEEKRKYLRLASTKTILSNLGFVEATKNLIIYDETLKTISYSISKDNKNIVTSKWNKNKFEVDDYYLGEHFPDNNLPHPE